MVDSLQTIGTARVTDSMDACRNLLVENLQLQEKKSEKIFLPGR